VDKELVGRLQPEGSGQLAPFREMPQGAQGDGAILHNSDSSFPVTKI